MMEQIPTKIFFPEFILQKSETKGHHYSYLFLCNELGLATCIFNLSYNSILSSGIHFILLLAVDVLYLCRLIAEIPYCLSSVLEDLACLFPAATLLNALPLHVSLFNLLPKGVCSFRAEQNLSGCLFAQEDCRGEAK